MVAANSVQNGLAWSEGWRLCAFIKWTRWTLPMATIWQQHHKHCHCHHHYTNFTFSIHKNGQRFLHTCYSAYV